MRYLITLLLVLSLISCGTYQLSTLQPTYIQPRNVIIDPQPQSWNYWWFYNRNNREYLPYYVPPRVIVVQPKSKVKGRRGSTVSPNRGRSNQTRSKYKKRN